ncbi:MAG: hypothetical protein ACJART_001499, partial [Maribacter sp.]
MDTNTINQFSVKKTSLFRLLKTVFIAVFIGSISCNAQKSTETVSLFDGSTLNGWKTVNQENTTYWSVVDSVITGGDGITNIPTNTYLHTTESYENFEFRALFRIIGSHDKGLINSGVQYRSIIEDNKIIGYQADIGKGYWGDIYDEHRRAKLVGGDLSTLKYILNEDGWNSYIVR